MNNSQDSADKSEQEYYQPECKCTDPGHICYIRPLPTTIAEIEVNDLVFSGDEATTAPVESANVNKNKGQNGYLQNQNVNTPPDNQDIDFIVDNLGNGALWCLRSDNTIAGEKLSKLKQKAKAKIEALIIAARVDQTLGELQDLLLNTEWVNNGELDNNNHTR